MRSPPVWVSSLLPVAKTKPITYQKMGDNDNDLGKTAGMNLEMHKEGLRSSHSRYRTRRNGENLDAVLLTAMLNDASGEMKDI